MSEWISVTEKMPPEWFYCLLMTTHYKTAVEGFWDGMNFKASRAPSDAVRVTHWMPLPEPPK